MKIILLLLIPVVGFAQLTVKNGTTIVGAAPVKLSISGAVSLPGSSATADFSKWDLSLNGGIQKVTALGPVTINLLEANAASTGNKTLIGNWSTGNLKLDKGNFFISTTPGELGKLSYTGTTILNNTGSATSYIQGPLSVTALGSGEVFFPIGNADGFFPVGFTSVTDANAIIQMEVMKGDPNITASSPDIKDYFDQRYWNFVLESGSFSGSPVRLSNTGTDAFKDLGGAGDLVIAEVTTNGTLNNLGFGSSGSDYLFSSLPASSSLEKLVIGKSNTVTVDITRFITPNNLDDKNNVLYIQNIEFYPENTVTLIDRWGVPVKEWKNFKNYADPSPTQSDFDFTKLSVGNYVCILEYKNATTNKTEKLLQMISVVK